MMDHEKHGGGKTYLKDFRQTASGEYIYTGRHMEYSSVNPIPFKKWFLRVCAFNAASVVLGAAGGFLPFDGLKNCIYVILPLVIELFIVSWTLFRLISSGRDSRLRLYAYDTAYKKLTVRNTAAMVFSVIGAIGSIVFELTGKPESGLIMAIIYAAFRLTSAWCQFFSCRLFKSAVWEEKQ